MKWPVFAAAAYIAGKDEYSKVSVGQQTSAGPESILRPSDPDGFEKVRELMLPIEPPAAAKEPEEIAPVLPKYKEHPVWDREILLTPVSRGPKDRSLVGLTIDDGFLNRDEILDILIGKEVSATFFLIGDRVIQPFPDFIRRALAAGFEIGNHTWTHGDLDKRSEQQIRDELAKCENAVLAADPEATTVPYLRPPGGNKNNLSIRVAADLGYRTFLWTIEGDTYERFANAPSSDLVNYYLKQIDALGNANGAILLLHFIPSTMRAIGSIIDGLRSRGLEPVSLSRLYEDGRS